MARKTHPTSDVTDAQTQADTELVNRMLRMEVQQQTFPTWSERMCGTRGSMKKHADRGEGGRAALGVGVVVTETVTPAGAVSKTAGFSSLLHRCACITGLCGCSDEKARRDFTAISRMVRVHQRGSGALYFLTLTLRHKAGESLAALETARAAGLRRVKGSKGGSSWEKDRRDFGILGTWTAIEATVSKTNGWHPHAHLLVFTNREWTQEESDLFKKRVFGRWVEGVMSAAPAGMREPSRERGIRLQLMTDRYVARDAATYMVKNFALSAAAELSGGMTKVGREKGSESFVQISERHVRAWVENGRQVIGLNKGERLEVSHDAWGGRTVRRMRKGPDGIRRERYLPSDLIAEASLDWYEYLTVYKRKPMLWCDPGARKDRKDWTQLDESWRRLLIIAATGDGLKPELPWNLEDYAAEWDGIFEEEADNEPKSLMPVRTEETVAVILHTSFRKTLNGHIDRQLCLLKAATKSTRDFELEANRLGVLYVLPSEVPMKERWDANKEWGYNGTGETKANWLQAVLYHLPDILEGRDERFRNSGSYRSSQGLTPDLLDAYERAREQMWREGIDLGLMGRARSYKRDRKRVESWWGAGESSLTRVRSRSRAERRARQRALDDDDM